MRVWARRCASVASVLYLFARILVSSTVDADAVAVVALSDNAVRRHDVLFGLVPLPSRARLGESGVGG
jgi:hypothetical protein